MYDFILRLPGLLLAIVIHEFSHGYMAYVRDNTIKKQGDYPQSFKTSGFSRFYFLLLFRFDGPSLYL